MTHARNSESDGAGGCCCARLERDGWPDDKYQVDDGDPDRGVGVRGTVLNAFTVTNGFEYITAVEGVIFSLSTDTYDLTASIWTDPTSGSPTDATRIATIEQTESFTSNTERTVIFYLSTQVSVGVDGSSFFVGITLDDDLILPVDSSQRHTYIQNGSSVPTMLNNTSLLHARSVVSPDTEKSVRPSGVNASPNTRSR